jgi:hypothetical protein
MDGFCIIYLATASYDKILHFSWELDGRESGPRSRWIESCARLQEEITFICTREQRGPVLDTSLKSKANTFAVAHTRARTHNLLLYPKSQSRGWNPFLRGFSLRLFYIYVWRCRCCAPEKVVVNIEERAQKWRWWNRNISRSMRWISFWSYMQWWKLFWWNAFAVDLVRDKDGKKTHNPIL